MVRAGWAISAWFGFALASLSPVAAPAQDAAEIDLIKSLFEHIQPVSIRRNVELCGFIGRNGSGTLAVSKPSLGDEDTCESYSPGGWREILGSYHTHAAYAPNYLNELPSDIDIESDMEFGTDGWLATPGGRLWFIDISERSIRQVCGIGCLPSDPNFVPGQNGRIKDRYTFKQLYVVLFD